MGGNLPNIITWPTWRNFDSIVASNGCDTRANDVILLRGTHRTFHMGWKASCVRWKSATHLKVCNIMRLNCFVLSGRNLLIYPALLCVD